MKTLGTRFGWSARGWRGAWAPRGPVAALFITGLLAPACASAQSAASGPPRGPAQSAPAASAPASAPARLTSLQPWRHETFVLVRNTRPGALAGGPVDLVRFDARTRQVMGRTPVALECERLHVAAGHIACMRYNRALSGASQLDVRDFALALVQESPIQSNSVVSRTRLSADGRYAGTTVFVSGHSYAVPGQFSTMTHLWDTRTRAMALSLDKLALTHEGQPVVYTAQTQLNYWGVTFDPREADRFYLTVSIRKRPHLAVGSVSRGSAHTVRADIECPSLSPDGTRIAFKKLRANGRAWDPAVLDLATGKETVYPAAKGVDDQIEWLDNDTLLYEATQTRLGGAKTDVMLRDVRRAGSPEQLWLEDAASPAVHRAAPAGTAPR